MRTTADTAPMRSFFRTIAVVVLITSGCDDGQPQTAVQETVQERPVTVDTPDGSLPKPDLPEQPVAAPTDGADTGAVANSATPVADSPAITAFLKKFDELSGRGFVPTLRSGSTGIGYTLETMLDIEENNSPGGDFMGMELKAFRDDDLRMDDSEKMNLFLKEPAWIDGLKHAARVKKYGYIDDDGRQAMYSTVQIKRNSHGWIFRVARDEQRVYMRFEDEDVAFWTFGILKKRLIEKHSEAVFVAAHARGKGKQEEFHYYAVTWCRDPAIEAFVDLIEAGDVMLELRMHVKESGSVRNHGSAFRIKQNKIPKLYGNVDQLRPLETQ